MMQPRILVHLGASDVPPQLREDSVEWVKKAVERGAEVARQGAKAEDIVAATVSVLEDSPVSDAGFGSVYNAEGGHQMDAGVMTGDLRYGAILSIHGVRNPIQVARKMVDDPKFSILCGEGAMKFVEKEGFEILEDKEGASARNSSYLYRHGAGHWRRGHPGKVYPAAIYYCSLWCQCSSDLQRRCITVGSASKRGAGTFGFRCDCHYCL